MTHELKVQPPYFDALLSGDKTFELRRNDRGFQRGDRLRLLEWDPNFGFSDAGRYTGRRLLVEVTYVLSGPWLQPDHVAMAIRRVTASDFVGEAGMGPSPSEPPTGGTA